MAKWVAHLCADQEITYSNPGILPLLSWPYRECYESPCWLLRCWQVLHRRWIWGRAHRQESVQVSPPWLWKTQGRHHQKSKIGVSVAPQKGKRTCVLQKLLKKRRWIKLYESISNFKTKVLFLFKKKWEEVLSLEALNVKRTDMPKGISFQQLLSNNLLIAFRCPLRKGIHVEFRDRVLVLQRAVTINEKTRLLIFACGYCFDMPHCCPLYQLRIYTWKCFPCWQSGTICVIRSSYKG